MATSLPFFLSFAISGDEFVDLVVGGLRDGGSDIELDVVMVEGSDDGLHIGTPCFACGTIYLRPPKSLMSFWMTFPQ